MPIIPFIVEQYVEEAALLWLRRDHAVVASHYALVDLANLDDQLESHLDGLRVAEADQSGAAWDVCHRELKWSEPGEVFAAAGVAWESGEAKWIGRVLEVGCASYENSRALVSSLGWLPSDQAVEYSERLLSDGDPLRRSVGLASAAVHRRDPGNALKDSLSDSDELLRARALRAIGELGRVDLVNRVREQLDEQDERVRYAAAWSAALLGGDEEALARLRGIVQAAGRESERALQLVVRRMPIEDVQHWLNELVRQSESVEIVRSVERRRPDELRLRLAVQGAGKLGMPHSIGWLLEVMQMPALARVAGEALMMITGIALDDQSYDGEWPEGFEAGPNEDPEDENVEMDTDENLPWPNREAIEKWWERNQHQFEPGTRYLLGQPITEDWLQHVLRHGYQRQRAAAALELAIRNPGQPLFDVRAPGWRQKKLLGLS